MYTQLIGSFWTTRLTEICHLKSVLSLLRQLSTRRYRHLLLSAGSSCRMAPAAEISCPQGAQQQTHRLPLLLLIDGTDGRTDARLLHKRCSSYCAGSVKNTVTSEVFVVKLIMIGDTNKLMLQPAMINIGDTNNKFMFLKCPPSECMVHYSHPPLIKVLESPCTRARYWARQAR